MIVNVCVKHVSVCQCDAFLEKIDLPFAISPDLLRLPPFQPVPASLEALIWAQVSLGNCKEQQLTGLNDMFFDFGPVQDASCKPL